MQYLGIYHNYNLPNINLPRFIDYIHDIELLTSYNERTHFSLSK